MREVKKVGSNIKEIENVNTAYWIQRQKGPQDVSTYDPRECDGERSKGKAKKGIEKKREMGQERFLEEELYLLVWKNK